MYLLLFHSIFIEEIEEDGGGGSEVGQEEYMKEQQANLAAERQKLLENHDMVESVSIYMFVVINCKFLMLLLV